ncbi:MAG: RimK family alpha-L-glutamate ligase [Desulfobacteraceae bacterium]|nr:MAG: RimK family alpha-L-glutamate ligase [Desulfobacteraceae bacterium]
MNAAHLDTPARSCGPWVALERRLRKCPQVTTLGVRPNFADYSARERELIRQAAKIYYPSALYADLMDTLGKRIFPSYHTYKFCQDKIKQTAIFQITGIPHPRTRIFFGRRQKAVILDAFKMPFIAKAPRGSALGQGVYLVRTQEELDLYCLAFSPAYIQEYLPIDRDIRVVVIGSKAVHAYWRIAPAGGFRTNVAQGGRIDLAPVPREAVALAEQTAHTCRWDDVGIDICEHKGSYFVLEANMKYGREGFRKAGIDYAKMMERLILNGEI